MSDYSDLHTIADTKAQEKAWRAAVEKERSSKPVAYVATANGYDSEGGKMVLAGETIVTSAPQGSWMDPIDKGEKAAIEASQTFRGDVSLETQGVAELRALALTLKVDPAGLNKADLITAIKAVDDPTR